MNKGGCFDTKVGNVIHLDTRQKHIKHVNLSLILTIIQERKKLNEQSFSKQLRER